MSLQYMYYDRASDLRYINIFPSLVNVYMWIEGRRWRLCTFFHFWRIPQENIMADTAKITVARSCVF